MKRSEASREERSCQLQLRVQPGAKRNELSRWNEQAWKVRIRAPAVEGAANRSLLKFLAQELGLKKSQVRLLRGERHREKLLQIEGITAGELQDRLERALHS